MPNPFRPNSLFGMFSSLAQGNNPFGQLVQPPVAPAMQPPPPVTAPAPMQAPQPNLKYREGIKSIESGGDYASLGPVTKTGDRAYGAYQVMGANVPQWTRQAIGKALTPDEFLKDPAAQDATFDHIFGQYVAKHGEENAAQAWFGGEGSIGQGGRTDQLGTSVSSYGRRFMDALGGTQRTPFTYANEKGNVNPAYARALASASGTMPGFTGLSRPTRNGIEDMPTAVGQRRGVSLTSQAPPQAQAEDPSVAAPYDYGAEEVQSAAQRAMQAAQQPDQRAAQRRELLKRKLKGEA